MNMSMKSLIIASFAALLTVVGFSGSALAGDEWPQPVDKWWESLKPGDTATFEYTMPPPNSYSMRTVTKIVKVKGTEITFSSQSFMQGTPLPATTMTIDVASKEPVPGVPYTPNAPKATITKGKNRTYKAGGKTFNCTEFTIKVEGQTTKVCHSTQLPLIFNGGNVTSESDAEGNNLKIKLIDYSGKLLK